MVSQRDASIQESMRGSCFTAGGDHMACLVSMSAAAVQLCFWRGDAEYMNSGRSTYSSLGRDSSGLLSVFYLTFNRRRAFVTFD